MNKVLIIGGATATGKTALAVECAKRLESEVISADSMLIYRGMDIGTAKPTAVEKDGVLHHMIDIVDLKDSFSVSDYSEKALKIVYNLLKKGKIPIICGGTGFYINSLLYDLSYGTKGSDMDLRKKYESLLKKHGSGYIYGILKEKDPETAEKLSKNDVKRIIRAIEIYEISGVRKSQIKDEFVPRFDYKAFKIDFPREILYDRINRRVDRMLVEGLTEEVKGLSEKGADKDCQSMQGIGYKETLQYLAGLLDKQQLSELIKKNTRNYAKRQITFFKKLDGIISLDGNMETARLADIAVRSLSE